MQPLFENCPRCGAPWKNKQIVEPPDGLWICSTGVECMTDLEYDAHWRHIKDRWVLSWENLNYRIEWIGGGSCIVYVDAPGPYGRDWKRILELDHWLPFDTDPERLKKLTAFA